MLCVNWSKVQINFISLEQVLLWILTSCHVGIFIFLFIIDLSISSLDLFIYSLNSPKLKVDISLNIWKIINPSFLDQLVFATNFTMSMYY